MKLLTSVMVVLIAGFLLTGCLYMNVKAPYDTDLNKTVLGQKTGKAQAQSLLWLLAWGDAGTAAAAKDGSITTVNHMDQDTVTVWVSSAFFQTFTWRTSPPPMMYSS